MKIKNKYKYLRKKYEERTDTKDFKTDITTDKRFENKVKQSRKSIISDREKKR
tara:strand:+ start:438 stop:596 length:159 start_codon:yes stop_codon:yes gene_type:complete